jgi:hypothetical protein
LFVSCWVQRRPITDAVTEGSDTRADRAAADEPTSPEHIRRRPRRRRAPLIVAVLAVLIVAATAAATPSADQPDAPTAPRILHPVRTSAGQTPAHHPLLGPPAKLPWFGNPALIPDRRI